MKKRAFTLIELMIVVSILGIMAAIVIPTLQGNTVQSKESAAKSSLRAIRSQIELYKMQHDNGPGYVSGIASSSDVILTNQLTGISNAAGAATVGSVATATYPYGPYLGDIPPNPFNDDDSIDIIASGTDFSAAADGTSSGWLYKVETGEFRLNYSGLDKAGTTNYYDY